MINFVNFVKLAQKPSTLARVNSIKKKMFVLENWGKGQQRTNFSHEKNPNFLDMFELQN